jgi:hypothetical protein
VIGPRSTAPGARPLAAPVRLGTRSGSGRGTLIRRLGALLAPSAVAIGVLASYPTAVASALGIPPPPPGAAPNPCPRVSLHLRCPNLVMSAPSELHLDRTTEPGHVLLRAQSSLNNHGTGPLEVRGRATPGGTMSVSQAIYDRRGRAHLLPTRAALVFKNVPGYRFDHPGVGDFDYWKFRYAAGFSLWSIDAKRRATGVVRLGPKLDYCLRDLFHTRPASNSPRTAVYPACNQSPGLSHDVLGTSAGWSDVYPYEYPEQYIDVTGLRGRFAYVQVVDPFNLLYEANEHDNVSETYIALPSGRVLGHRVAVSRP